MPEKQKQSRKFTNVFDYIDWRGDLSFESAPVCEVDGLIFSILSYVDYGGFVPSEIHGVRKPLALLTVTKRFLKSHSGSDVPAMGLILSKEIVKLLAKASKTKRFGLLSPICYVNRICDEEEKQFSAIAFSFENGDVFIAYRGTDDTLVGWKENFNMSFIYPVPAQKEAVRFLEYVASKTSGRIYLGGHSKGGNLAVYAGVKASPAVKERIERIYSNDAPGFDAEFICGSDYRDMQERIKTFLPQSSVVGMLLEHEESYTVIKSRSSGLLQHDGFSWEVLGSRFIYLDSISEGSRIIDKGMKKVLSELSKEERERFVDTLFDSVSEKTGAKTLTELNSEKMKLFKVWNTLDEVSRAQFKRIAGILIVRKNQEKKKEKKYIGDGKNGKKSR